LSRRAVFLDRDDTIIRDKNYLDDPDEVELLPGAAEAIRLLNDHGIPAIIVTNQSGIARGLFDVERLDLVHLKLMNLLAERHAAVDGIYFCPHHPQGSVKKFAVSCSCRKPEPGLLLQAAQDFGLDLAGCYMVGDKPLDSETIHRVGGKGVLIGEPTGDEPPAVPDYRAQDLLHAVQWILGDMER
jgi:D-glycero-D-manno-heptose 1,7-bisphosphate phosphatase